VSNAYPFILSIKIIENPFAMKFDPVWRRAWPEIRCLHIEQGFRANDAVLPWEPDSQYTRAGLILARQIAERKLTAIVFVIQNAGVFAGAADG
jgi:hypothetical protein